MSGRVGGAETGKADVVVLGPVGVDRSGTLIRPPSGTARALLGALALGAPSGLSALDLTALVWGARGAPSTSTLGVAVHRLRAWLRDTTDGTVSVPRTGNRYALRLHGSGTDVETFRRLTGAARSAADEQERAAVLEQALNLWRGQALEDVSPERVDHGAVAQLERKRGAVAAEYARTVVVAGIPERALPLIGPLVDLYPLDEPLLSAWVEALACCGRQAEALDVFERTRERLRERLGVDPGPELRDVHIRVLRQETVPRDTASRPQQVPAAVADFTGRGEHVRHMVDLLSPEHHPQAAVVPVIAGMGGVGKTTLAQHLAHHVQENFPDGQLYIDLRGTEAVPAEPGEVLGRFLRALGVTGTSALGETTERGDLYRSLLADRRMLVVLDNAADEEQVTPLLPGGAGCRVIVTSRARLTGLAGTRLTELDVLEPEQAVELLTRTIGTERAAAEPEAITELAGLCGGLPLALRVAGARLAAKPHWRVTELVTRLGGRHRLDELIHHGLSVRATLDLSYEGLDDDARLLYRLLGLIDAPDIPEWLPAVLLDRAHATADDVVERLVDTRLLDVVRLADGEPRYRLHDLVRDHARDRGRAEDDPGPRRRAVRRALDVWLTIADTVMRAVNQHGDTVVRDETVGSGPAAQTAEHAAAHPARWLETERYGLPAAVRQAAWLGDDELCWRLAVRAAVLFQPAHYLDAWRQVLDAALPVVRAADNRFGEAAIRRWSCELACARRDYADALREVGAALALCDAATDPHGTGLALRQRAVTYRMTGRYADALRDAERAGDLLRGVGDFAGLAHALMVMGGVRCELGESEAAVSVLTEAHDVAHDAHDASIEIQSVYWSGLALLDLGRPDEARGLFEYVGRAATAAGSRLGGMYAAYGRGRAYTALGRCADAERALMTAFHLADQRDDRLTRARVLHALAGLSRDSGDLETAGRRAGQALALAEAVVVPLWEARCRLLLADVHSAAGDDATARDLHDDAMTVLAELGVRTHR